MNVVNMILEHPYPGLALGVLVEGPTATLVAGTLVATGAIHWWPALALAVFGDCLADTVWFLLGRAGVPRPGSLRARLFHRVGVTPQRWEALQARCQRRLPWLVGGAKLADVAAVPTFAALGASGVAYRRFLGWIAAVTSVKSAALLVLGWALARNLLPAGTTPGAALLMGTGLSITAALALSAGLLVVRRRRARRHPLPAL